MGSDNSKIPSIHIADFEPVSSDVVNALPAGLVRQQKVVPLKKFDGRLIVAVSKTEGVIKPEGLSLVTGCPVEIVTAPAEEISNFIQRHYKDTPVKKMFVVPAENIILPEPKSVEPLPSAPVTPAAPILHEANHPAPEAFNFIVGGPVPDLAAPGNGSKEPDFEDTLVDLDVDADTAAFLEIPFEPSPVKPEVIPVPSPVMEPPKVIETPKPVEAVKPVEKPKPVEAVKPIEVAKATEPVKRVELVPPVPRDPSLTPEFVSMMTEAVANRATEVLVSIKGDRYETRHRIRGTLISVLPGKGGLYPAQADKLLMWVAAVGERQSSEGLEWYDARKEFAIGDDVYTCHAFLTLSRFSKLLTVRLSSRKSALYSPTTWGMDAAQGKALGELLERKQGLILFTGSDNDGISSNLNACARFLATPKRHMIIVEPFLESWMADVDQFVAKGESDYFGRLLKVAAKHAPDVLIASPLERRDHFEICLSESLKGRLVLGRSYASDCADALIQLAGMGIEPYLIGSAMIGVVAKRTIRLNCPVCQEKDPIGRSQAREMGIPDAMLPSSFYASKGCDSCNNTGFQGETDIFEVLSMTTDLKNAFGRDAKPESIRAQIKTSGLLTLRQVAVHKAVNGQTSLAEVLRTTPK